MQNYLKNGNITVQEAQNLFKYRTKVARFKENFRNNYDETGCLLCLDQLDHDSFVLKVLTAQTQGLKTPSPKTTSGLQPQYSITLDYSRPHPQRIPKATESRVSGLD